MDNKALVSKSLFPVVHSRTDTEKTLFPELRVQGNPGAAAIVQRCTSIGKNVSKAWREQKRNSLTHSLVSG